MEFKVESKSNNDSDLEEEEEEEGIVDLKGECINALNELKKPRKKNKQLKE